MNQSSIDLEENKEEKIKVPFYYVNQSMSEEVKSLFDSSRYSTDHRLIWVEKNVIKFIKKIRKQPSVDIMLSLDAENTLIQQAQIKIDDTQIQKWNLQRESNKLYRVHAWLDNTSL